MLTRASSRMSSSTVTGEAPAHGDQRQAVDNRAVGIQAIGARVDEEGVIQGLNFGDDHAADIALRLHGEGRVLEVHNQALADDDAIAGQQVFNPALVGVEQERAGVGV